MRESVNMSLINSNFTCMIIYSYTYGHLHLSPTILATITDTTTTIAIITTKELFITITTIFVS